MNEEIVTVDGVNYLFDDIGYEYSQLDGDEAGRSEDGTMYRSVIGLTNKISCDVLRQTLNADDASSFLKLLEKTSAVVNYYDLKENSRVTKTMYIVGDAIKMRKLDGEIYVQPFQIRFIQMNTDNIG